MPRPPDVEKILADLLSQMKIDLLKDLQASQRKLLEEMIDKQRSLFTETVNETFDGKPSLDPVAGEVVGCQLVPVEQSMDEQLRNGNVMTTDVIPGSEAIENSPTIQNCDEAACAHVSGRGATWIADVDRTSLVVKAPSLYKSEGWCVKVSESQSFHIAALVVICLNALYLGIEADWNPWRETPHKSDLGWQIMENVFCILFFLELLIRAGSFAEPMNFIHDRWFLFDFGMVVLMVFETWMLPIFFWAVGGSGSGGAGALGGMARLLRLLRLTRISKLGKMFPELVTMVKGIVAAIRAVHAALFILILLVYVFAIALHNLVGDTINSEDSQNWFGTVRDSMVTLILNGVLLDNIGELVLTLVAHEKVGGLIILVGFILLTAVTVMNMLIGVLCEVVIDVSAEEKETMAREKMKKTLLVMLENLDDDGSGYLNKAEILDVVNEPKAIALFNDIQVDVQYLLDISEMLFSDPDTQLPIGVFMNIVLTLRGRRTPTMNDIMKAHNLNMWAIETQLTHHRRLMSQEMQTLSESLQMAARKTS